MGLKFLMSITAKLRLCFFCVTYLLNSIVSICKYLNLQYFDVLCMQYAYKLKW